MTGAVALDGRPEPWTSSLVAFRALHPILRRKAVEHFYVVALDVKMRPIGRPVCVGLGSVSACLVHPREIFHVAIRRRAFTLLVAHNHPSGDATPSDEDVALTRRLVAAGEILGIRVCDHLVVTRHDFFSFADSGRL